MIRDFGQNIPTPQVVEKELKMKPEDFDKQFLAWIDAQTKTQVASFDTWSKQVKDLNNKVKAKDWDGVIKEGTEARDLYPDYVDPGSVYEALAQAYEAKKDDAKAMEQLSLYSKIGGRNPDSLRELAKLQESANDLKGAQTTLEKINYIYLRDDKEHQMLADLDMKLKDPTDAAREYGAVIALKPVDPAGAHYHLAEADHEMHKDHEALDEVLSSLESAPGYRDAQKLLLELTTQSTNKK
jgi:tetratricopeptide (TPR) repeat protein